MNARNLIKLLLLLLLPGQAIAGPCGPIVDGEQAVLEGRYGDAEQLCAKALGAGLNEVCQVRALACSSEAVHRLRRTPEALKGLRAAYEKSGWVQSAVRRASIKRAWGRALVDSRQVAEGRRHLEGAVASLKTARARAPLAVALIDLAAGALMERDLAAARAAYAEALAVADPEDLRIRAAATEGLAGVDVSEGWLQRGADRARQAAALHLQRADDRRSLRATSLAVHALANTRRPRALKEATRIATRARRQAARIGDLRSVGRLGYWLAAIKLFNGRPEAGVLALEALRGDLGSSLDPMTSLYVDLGLAQGYSRIGRIEDAGRIVDRLRARRLINADERLGLALPTALIEAHRGKPREAIRILAAAIEAHERAARAGGGRGAGYFGGWVEPYVCLLWLYVDEGMTNEAINLIALIKARAHLDATAAQDPGRIEALLGTGRLSDPPPAPIGVGAVLEYYTDQRGSLLAAYDGRKRIWSLHRLPGNEGVLSAAVRAFVGAIDAEAPWEGHARTMAGLTIKPVAEALASLPQDAPVAVVPHGPLHGVPWDALPVGQGALIDTALVFEVPSVRLIAQHQFNSPWGLGRITALVDSQGDLKAARFAAFEAVAELGAGSIVMGPEISKGQALEALRTAGILHFGLHTRDSGDIPALVLGSEPGALDPPSDGWRSAGDAPRADLLTSKDLSGLKINAELVNLAACNSAKGEMSRGDDSAALDRAFLVAGARGVLSTRGRIHDGVTAMLNRRFYKTMAADGPLRALTMAKRMLRAGPSRAEARGLTEWPEITSKRLTHPRFWAAYRFVGRP